MDELRLRPYKRCDANKIAGWITNEKSFYQWSADRLNDFPLTPERLNEYYDEYQEDERFFQMTAVDDSGMAAAHMMMRYPEEGQEVLRFGFIVVNDQLRGKGYGKKFLKLALEYAFNILKVKKVTLGVFANNPGARHCYEAVGFLEAKENSRNTYRIMDEDWECIEMEFTREQWMMQ